MVGADGRYTTYDDGCPAELPAKAHPEEVTDCVAYLEQQGFAKPLMHLIDREGELIGHIRRWERADGLWLVRSKDTR